MEFYKKIIGKQILTILNKYRNENGKTWPSILNYTHEVQIFSHELFGICSIDNA